MSDTEYAHEYDVDLRASDLPGSQRERLAMELRDKSNKLDEQARIFVPLIALCVIAAIPVWSRSPLRFLALLINPFVLLPLSFCVIHLALAWRRIANVRNRIRELERDEENRAEQQKEL
jgi:hypothetical protein